VPVETSPVSDEAASSQSTTSPFLSNAVVVVDGSNVYKFDSTGEAIQIQTGSLSGPLSLLQASGAIPRALVGFTVTPIGGETYLLFGGQGKGGGSGCWTFHTGRQEWAQSTPLGPPLTTRFWHAAAFNLGVLYVFGGLDGRDCTNDLVVLPLDKRFYAASVIRGSGLTPQPRYQHSFTAFRGKLWLFGGRDIHNRAFCDLWSLGFARPPFREDWTLVSEAGPGLRYRHQAFVRDDHLFIVGGISETGAPLNDIWKFDGAHWQQVAVFDLAPTYFGCDYGLYAIVDNCVRSVSERPALLLLAGELTTVKMRYESNIDHMKRRLASINDRRIELERVRRMFDENCTRKRTSPGEGAGANQVRDYFNPQVENALRAEIVGLRGQFVKAAAQVLSKHAADFCVPIAETPNVLFDYSVKLPKQLARVTAKYQAHKDELLAENAFYRSLNKTAPLAMLGKDRGCYDAIVAHIEKIRLVQQQRKAIADKQAKVAKMKSGLVDQDARMCDLLGMILAVDDQIASAKLEMRQIESKIAGIDALIEKSQMTIALMSADQPQAQQILAKPQKRLDQLQADLTRAIKEEIVPLEQRVVVRQLSGVMNFMARISPDTPNGVALIKHQVAQLVPKLRGIAGKPIAEKGEIPEPQLVID
jgi:hypothetical protein